MSKDERTQASVLGLDIGKREKLGILNGLGCIFNAHELLRSSLVHQFQRDCTCVYTHKHTL